MNKTELASAMKSLAELSQSNLFSSDFTKNTQVQGGYVNILIKMNYSLFDKTLNETLSEVKYFPKPFEIQKAYNKVQATENQKISEARFEKDCPLCRNNGVFIYRKLDKNNFEYEYGARCICERGNKYHGAPKIDSVLNLISLQNEAQREQISIQEILKKRTYSNDHGENIPVFS